MQFMTPLRVPSIVPHPLDVRVDDGAPFTITASTAVVSDGACELAAAFLAHLLGRATGFEVPVHDARTIGRTMGPSISLSVDPDMDVPPDSDAAGGSEAYVLRVGAAGVSLVGRTGHAVFNGVQTLRQLLPPWVESAFPTETAWEIPAVCVVDRPRFGYRGVMLDVARSFLSVAEVKFFVDALVGMKLNVLHLHLADDQGWRIEITNEGRDSGDPFDYSALTRRSGISAIAQSGYRGELGRAGWYRQQDYAEIVSYCAERYVTVIPEIDVPGHTNAALHALPQLNTPRSLPVADRSTGVVRSDGTDEVGYSALDENSELTYRFARHVFRQLAALSPGPYVHIGGDESHDMGAPRFREFIRRVIPAVRDATGRKVIGWQEIARIRPASDGTDWRGVVAQYWAGDASWVADFVDHGGSVICAHENTCYLDMKYHRGMPIGRDAHRPERHTVAAYRQWDPADQLGRIDDLGILGVEAPLWSETVRGVDQALYLALPRAAAVLEVGWSPRGVGEDDFSHRLGELGPRFVAAGQTFFGAGDVEWATALTGIRPPSSPPRPDGSSRQVSLVAWVAAPGTRVAQGGECLLRCLEDRSGGATEEVTGSGGGGFTASVDLDGEAYPVRFMPVGDAGTLGPSGLFAAYVEGQPCGCGMLRTSAGHLLPTDIVTCDIDDLVKRPEGEQAGSPAMRLGVDGSVHGGEWEPLTISGCCPRSYARVEVGDRWLGVVRADSAGNFTGWVPLPVDLLPGRHAVAVRCMPERSAAATQPSQPPLRTTVWVAGEGGSTR